MALTLESTKVLYSVSNGKLYATYEYIWNQPIIWETGPYSRNMSNVGGFGSSLSPTPTKLFTYQTPIYKQPTVNNISINGNTLSFLQEVGSVGSLSNLPQYSLGISWFYAVTNALGERPSGSMLNNSLSVIVPKNFGTIATFSYFSSNPAIATLEQAGYKQSFNIVDTAANISSNLDLLQSKLSGISSISATDRLPLLITSQQQLADAGVLALIQQSGGSYLLNSAHTFIEYSRTMNEGQSNGMLVQTTGVASGTVLNYSISGITSDRLTNGSLTGTTTVGSNGQALIALDIKANNRTDGPSTATVTIGNNLATASVQINDTSLTPTGSPLYSFTEFSSRMNEGQSNGMLVQTTGVPVGTVLNYSISGITWDRLTNGLITGTTTVDGNGQARINLDIKANNRTDGPTTAVITIGNNLATASVSIFDTSLTPVATNPLVQTTNTISIIPGNTINSSAANDLINGTTTTDTVLYSGSIKDYKVAMGSNGNYTVIDAVSSRDGNDVVVNVERLKFSPDPATGANRIALDLSPTQATGKAALLIGAVLPGKLALDPSKYQLMGAVIDLFDQGFSLQALSGALLRLPIWDVLTGKPNPTNTDIATYLVNNVYGVTSQSSNLGADLARSLAISAMNAETPTTQGTYLATLATSTASQSHIDLVGIQSTGLVYMG